LKKLGARDVHSIERNRYGIDHDDCLTGEDTEAYQSLFGAFNEVSRKPGSAFYTRKLNRGL
jgi:hypothetical protein